MTSTFSGFISKKPDNSTRLNPLAFNNTILLPKKILQSDCYLMLSFFHSNDEKNILETGSLIIYFSSTYFDKNKLLTMLPKAIHRQENLALVAAAYNELNSEITQYLRGNYQLIIWDKITKQLICANSPFSLVPLYYRECAEGFYFTNYFPVFKALFSDLLLNKKQLANLLLRHNAVTTHTCYLNIFKLPTNHQLTYQAGKITTHKTLHRTYKIDKWLSRKKIVSSFRKCLINAVEDYTPPKKPIASHLSGGLDSTSVALVAAKALKKQDQSLTCFSAVPKKKFTFPNRSNASLNDFKLVKAAQKTAGNIKLELINCDNPGIPFTQLAKFCYQYSESPAFNVMNMGWITRIYQIANQKNIHTLLTGSYGNFTISYKGRRHNHLIMRFAAKLKNKLFNPKYNPMLYSLLNPTILKKYNLKLRKNPYSYNTNFQETFLERQLDSAGTIDLARALQVQYNVTEYDPTTHPDIIDFCFNLPNRAFYHKKKHRALIRDAMKGIIPEAVRRNTLVGAQAASWFYELKSALPYYFKLLPKFKKNALITELINLKELEQYMNEMRTIDPFKRDPSDLLLKFRVKLARTLHIAEWIYLHELPAGSKPFSEIERAHA